MGFKSRVNRAEWPNIDRKNRVFTSPPITATQNLIATCLEIMGRTETLPIPTVLRCLQTTRRAKGEELRTYCADLAKPRLA